MRARVLVVVEDPGAANFVATLPEDLVARGIPAVLLASGAARLYLEGRGVSAAPFEGPDGALDRHRPDLVVCGTSENPDSPVLALIDEARRRGILTAGAVDAPMNAAHRFRGRADDPLAHAPDRLLVPDAVTGAAYEAIGFPAGDILVCGHPHYDVVRAERARLDREGRVSVRARRFPGVAPGRCIVVFIAEIRGGLDEDQFRRGPDFTLAGWGTSEWRSEIALEEFLDAAQVVAPRPYLVLRLPPKGRDDEFAPYAPAFDEVSRAEPLPDLLYAADLVAGMTSIPLVEAVLLGRPTLSILCRAVERRWLPTIETGETETATTRTEVEERLRRLLRSSGVPAAGDRLPRGGRARLTEAVAGILTA